jgi:hypothetical protein
MFTAVVVNDPTGTTLELNPKLAFNVISDSANVLLAPKELNIIYSGDLKKAKSIYKNKNFQLRVLLFQYYEKNNNKYQIVLRSFSPDMKIIDTFILATTKDIPDCSGYVTEDLQVKKSCDDGSEIIAQIDTYGKFIEVTP